MHRRVGGSAVSFISPGPPRPANDFDTRAQKTDDAGLPINQVHRFTVGDAGRDVITVKVAGDIKGVLASSPW